MPRRNHTPKHTPFIDNNTCKVKRRFTNELSATQAASLQELQNNEAFSVYKCERCSGWHLTKEKATT